MPFTQETFFGASIANFRASIGWGSQLSTLNITLVEDNKRNEVFTPTAVGQPSLFQYQDWKFRGILQSWVKSKNESANPIYEVTLTDPREILNGVQLIIDNYTGGTFSVPNLYNVYGYWENLGFGQSQINEAGMPWQLIRTAFSSIQATSPIEFRGYNYTVNLSALPLIPSYYRVAGEYISLFDFVDEICEVGGVDYFYTLEPGSVITLSTISRKSNPTKGKIQEFINALEQVHASDVGEELRNDMTNKFVVGGKVEYIYYQFYNEGIENDIEDRTTFFDDTIWPYWGKDVEGNVLLGVGDFAGEGSTEAHRVDLDSRLLGNVHYTTTYPTNIDEMRAALMGQDSWEAFLWDSNDEDGPHKNKAQKLGVIEVGNKINLEGKPRDDVIAGAPPLLKMPGQREIDNGDTIISDHETQINKLYEWVAGFAKEYYGRKFMVRIPFLLVKREPETERIVTSVEPNESGFLEEDVWDDAVALNLLPLDILKFTDDNNKIVCYVRYADILNAQGEYKYDFSLLNEEDYTIYNNSAFIKCEIDPEIIYLDKDTFFSPRAVITLPAPVFSLEDHILHLGATNRLFQDENFTEQEQKDLASRYGDDAMVPMEAKAVMPEMAAIPLISNIQFYGPWFSIGVAGKTEFEQDNTLVPWNYGGFTEMNLVGNAKVSEAFTGQQESESGSITFPGVPVIEIGRLLIAGGPLVTDVNVDISENGATTTYRMQTWSRNLFGMVRFNVDRLERLNRAAIQNRRKLRELVKTRLQIIKTAQKTRRLANRIYRASSISVIGADVIKNNTTGFYTANVVGLQTYGIAKSTKHNYDKKALATLDVVFRPFSTDTTTSGIPHFEVPSGTVPNAANLNPFSAPHDFGAMIRGSSVPNKLVLEGGDSSDKYRAIGLRLPAIGVGWGYDTNGKPVPNANPNSPGDSFADNYKQRMDLWKAGPIDLRWDNTKKVWSAFGGGAGIEFARLTTRLDPGGNGSGVIQRNNETVNIKDTYFNCFGLPNEFVSIAANSSGVYEVIGEFGLRRRVITVSLSPNTSGFMNLAETTGSINVVYDWMDGGAVLPSGKEAVASFYKDKVWRLDNREC